MVLGTSINVGSGACNQPRVTVLAGCDDECGAPAALRNVALDHDKALGTTHVRHPP
jgi:hypothetical protein